MSRYFYSLDDQTRIGPVTIETLRALLVAGTLQPHHFIFAEGAPDWTEARLIPGLVAPEQGQDPGAAGGDRAAAPARPRPSGLRRINTSEYASIPRVRGVRVAKGLYGPPEPCPLRYRALAALTDAAILLLLLSIALPAAHALARAIAGAPEPTTAWWVVTLGVATVVAWLYNAGLEASAWMGTPGKRAMTVRVTTREGARVSFRRATVRHFAKALSILPLGLGLLAAWFDPRFRAWHDRLAGSVVERTPPV